MQGSGAPENAGPNKNLAAVDSGSDRRARIFEDWQLLTHGDGTQTLLLWRVDARRGTQVDALFRAAPSGPLMAAFVHEQPRAGAPHIEFSRDRDHPLASDFFSRRAAGKLDSRPLRGIGPANLTRTGVARWARGRYAYTTFKDGRARGTEDFHLTVHTDGSRSLTLWHDVFARHSQFSVSLSIDASQRPTDAFVSYWTVAGYKGSTHLHVQGDALIADYRGPSGDQTATTPVPARFSLGTHPVAGDGWHTFQCGDAPGSEAVAKVYTMEASADLTRPMLGSMTELPCVALGAERITVPGGTFDTLHYRLAGVSDVWITRQDRLMVKFTSEKLDRAYTLLEFYGEGFTQNQL